MTSQPEPSLDPPTRVKVGHTLRLKRSCFVVFPDGFTVSAWRTCRFTAPGEYRVDYGNGEVDLFIVEDVRSGQARTEPSDNPIDRILTQLERQGREFPGAF